MTTDHASIRSGGISGQKSPNFSTANLKWLIDYNFHLVYVSNLKRRYIDRFFSIQSTSHLIQTSCPYSQNGLTLGQNDIQACLHLKHLGLAF